MTTFRAYPRYSYPPHLVLGLVRDGLLGRRRKFRDDACACIAQLRPPLRVLGSANIPVEGCYAITLNHYYRPGFASQWSALAISASLPADVRWIMTDELTFPGSWLAPLGRPISHLVLSRIARVYDFFSMPPMPPRPRDVAARAAAVRRVLHFLMRSPNSVVAVAPEGGDQPGGRLSMPPAGAGRFCALLAEAGLRFLPVGVYEWEGALTLNFGESYELYIPRSGSSREKDHLAAFTLMSRIAPLLPSRLRGDFPAQVY